MSIKRTIYATRADAGADIIDYMEMFYNPKRRHDASNNMPPVEYKRQYRAKLACV